MNTKICSECNRPFPRNLLRELEVGSIDEGGAHVRRKKEMCPLCAYVRINTIHGLRPGTPPPADAPIARKLWDDAHAWLAKQEALKKA